MGDCEFFDTFCMSYCFSANGETPETPLCEGGLVQSFWTVLEGFRQLGLKTALACTSSHCCDQRQCPSASPLPRLLHGIRCCTSWWTPGFAPSHSKTWHGAHNEAASRSYLLQLIALATIQLCGEASHDAGHCDRVDRGFRASV